MTAPLRRDLETALSAVWLPAGLGEAIEYANGLLRRSEAVAFACGGASRSRTRKVLVVTDQRLIAAGRERGLVEGWSIDRGAINAVSVAAGGAEVTVRIDTRAGFFTVQASRSDGHRLAAALRG